MPEFDLEVRLFSGIGERKYPESMASGCFAKDVKSMPKVLVAMACYSKGDEIQFSLKELAKHLLAVQLEFPDTLNPT